MFVSPEEEVQKRNLFIKARQRQLQFLEQSLARIRAPIRAPTPTPAPAPAVVKNYTFVDYKQVTQK